MQKDYSTAKAECMCETVQKAVEWIFQILKFLLFLTYEKSTPRFFFFFFFEFSLFHLLCVIKWRRRFSFKIDAN